LADERTWLAWFRTGLAAAAVAIAVGGILPDLSTGVKWPYRLLGLGYGLLAAAILVLAAARQRRFAEALQHGDPAPPLGPLVMWLTVAAVALTTATLTLLAIYT
jgi:putative membrane protein